MIWNISGDISTISQQEVKQETVKQLHTYYRVNVDKYQVIACPVHSYINMINDVIFAFVQ